MRTDLCLRLLPLLLCASLLTGCGSHDRADASRTTEAVADGEALPTPEGTAGITGSADLGPGPGTGDTAPLLGDGPAETVETPPQDPFFSGLPPEAVNPETGLGVDPDGDGPLTAPAAVDAGAAEPTAADAVVLVRDYYAAINARNFPAAYALWSNDGRASGQSPEQFAGGFAATRGVSLEVGAPGQQDAGAGQRFIQVPVALTATQADGSVRRYAGTYTLHRTVVDGATPGERNWRIRNAELREVQP